MGPSAALLAAPALLTLLLLISSIPHSKPYLLEQNSKPDEESSSIISRFQRYLQINSSHPNPNYSEAADFILSIAKTLNLESETLEFVPGKPLILLKWPGKDPNLPSVLLNSHTDVVPAEDHKWAHPPFAAHLDAAGDIYARGSQDMKCVGLQYLEAIRRLKGSGFEPSRTIYLSFVPDEEIGGHDGAKVFAESERFKKMNVGIVLDEGLASPDESYRAFYAERCPWWLEIRSFGAPGHGSKLYDNSAMENLMKSIELVRRFRAAQFDMVKAGSKEEGEVISVNMVFLKAGTPSPTGFVMNLQPSEASAGFDIRVPPSALPDYLEKRIAEEWAPSSRNMTFEVGDYIMVRIRSDRLPHGAVKKFHPRSAGPYKILKKVGPNAYVIDLPPDCGMSATFNVEDLVAFHGTTAIPNLPSTGSVGAPTDPTSPLSPQPSDVLFPPDQPVQPLPLPPPVQAHRDEIEYIADHEVVSTQQGGFQKFLVKWKSRPVSDRTWMTETELQ